MDKYFSIILTRFSLYLYQSHDNFTSMKMKMAVFYISIEDFLIKKKNMKIKFDSYFKILRTTFVNDCNRSRGLHIEKSLLLLFQYDIIKCMHPQKIDIFINLVRD